VNGEPGQPGPQGPPGVKGSDATIEIQSVEWSNDGTNRAENVGTPSNAIYKLFLRDLVETLQIEVPTWVCTDDESQQIVTETLEVIKWVTGDESELFITLFQQLFTIAQALCEIPAVDVPRQLLADFTADVENRAVYVNLPVGCEMVEILVVNDPLPPRLDYYSLNPVEGPNAKFGVVGAVWSLPDGEYVDTQTEYIWTRKSLFRVPEGGFPVSLRLLLQPEINVRIFDTGKRSKPRRVNE
jgi:hypothetical protein